MGFKRKAQVTKPLISMAHTPELQVKILTEPSRIEMPRLARSEDGMVSIIDVVDLNTGEEAMLICPTVLIRLMEEGDVVVGGCYEIVDAGVPEGKDYRAIKVYELEVTEE